jgi:PAS domain S-box-containing protein
VDHPHGGVFFYFVTCSLAGLILLNYYHSTYSILFALLPILLGYLAYTTDLNLMPSPVYSEEMIRVNFISNLTIGILTNVFIVYFVINRNTETEKSLRDSEKNLIKISADLKVSEERFAMALQGTRAGIYEWRVKNNSIYVSPYWKNLLGYEDHELNELTVQIFLSFIHPEDIIQTSQSIETHLQTHVPYQNELRIRTKSGGYKWFLDSGISKLDEEGNPSVVIGSIIDIDERKKAEEELALKNMQLAKTNEELDRFVYSASHDMRAPLSSLLGLIYISEKATNPEEVKDYLNRMKSRVKVMEGFIKEVTDYSRNARFEVAWKPILFHDLIKEIIDSLNYSLHSEKPDVKILAPEDLSITCDPHRLRIIMNNLLANAFKYADPSKPKQEIKIVAQKNDTHWMFTIQDNGVGIPEEHLPRIFEMFFRASENSEGSGLGLYIVKETLEKLNGEVSVQSTLHEGTSFTVTLPLNKKTF